MKNSKKRITSIIWIGIKEGWHVELMPAYILAFEKLFWVQKCKKICPILITIIVSGYASTNFNTFFYYFSLFLSISYILYRIFVSILAVYSFLSLLIKGKLFVKNSPNEILPSAFKILSLGLRVCIRIGLGVSLTFAMAKKLKGEQLTEGNSTVTSYDLTEKDNIVKSPISEDLSEKDSIVKNSIFEDLQSFLANWLDYLNSLDLNNLILIFNILSDFLLLSILISNLIGRFGNYWIEKFKLEERYPILSRYIYYRMRIQKIYFYYSVVLAFSTIILGLYLNITTFLL